MPPSENAQLKDLTEQVRQIKETVLLTLGDKDRPGVLMAKLDQVCEKVDDTHVICHGDPKQPGSGLLFRLDRIEQKHATWSRVLWTSVVAIIGVVAKGVWDLFHKA
jgi:hypothetical protein